MNVVLITGCSSGFGYLSALTFARQNWQVIAGVRSIDARSNQLKKIAAKEKLPIEIVKLDVTKDRDVSNSVKQILQKYKKIDVLVNNAGFGLLGPIEDFSIAEIKRQYDVNVLGVVRMCQAVLPSMRKRKAGRIINISSILGLIPFGMYGVYASSKHAIEALSEALRFEVARFGVDVTLLEPGSFETNFSAGAQYVQNYTGSASAYKQFANPTQTVRKPGGIYNNRLVKKLRDPQQVANKIFALATAETTKMRYQIGMDAWLYYFAKKLLPPQLWEATLHKVFRW